MLEVDKQLEKDAIVFAHRACSSGAVRGVDPLLVALLAYGGFGAESRVCGCL